MRESGPGKFILLACREFGGAIPEPECQHRQKQCAVPKITAISDQISAGGHEFNTNRFRWSSAPLDSYPLPFDRSLQFMKWIDCWILLPFIWFCSQGPSVCENNSGRFHISLRSQDNVGIVMLICGTWMSRHLMQ